MKNKIWLIGAGSMAIEYANVLKSLGSDFTVIGRGEGKVKLFGNKTGIKAISGGLSSYIQQTNELPTFAIVATGVEALAETTLKLINAGVKTILCEKPGGINYKEIAKVSKRAAEKNAKVFLAYNRRFYASVQKAKEIIKEDGGVTSFNFEFTEWSHVIAPLEKGLGVKENWFLANSTHVVDLAFYLGGKPQEIKCYTSGALSWHKSSSIFAGAGVSKTGALFSYQANWQAPGRWGVEVLTKYHRLYLRPLEQLQIQAIGSTKSDFVDIDDSIDKTFKPGLYKQVESFLNKKFDNFIMIEGQLEITNIYYQISGYKE